MSGEPWIVYLSIGACSGLLGGLLGLGGGLIIVPALIFLFKTQGIADLVSVQLALGTSLACIVPTAMASLHQHQRHGAVNAQILRRISPGILLGALLGSLLAAQFSSNLLKALYVIFACYVATQILLERSPKTHRPLPGLLGMSLVGTGIGTLSSLLGIGGGTLSVPFLRSHQIPLRQAIGNAAAIGLPIAVAGTLGYIANGWSAPQLPPHSLGFVYLPAFAAIASASILFAPVGAKLTHRLPIPLLKRIFAGVLYLIGLKMALSLMAN